jgi:hypothetical protein
MHDENKSPRSCVGGKALQQQQLQQQQQGQMVATES